MKIYSKAQVFKLREIAELSRELISTTCTTNIPAKIKYALVEFDQLENKNKPFWSWDKRRPHPLLLIQVKSVVGICEAFALPNGDVIFYDDMEKIDRGYWMEWRYHPSPNIILNPNRNP